ncbi:MAG TPA: proton-conducting transporter membrane subunit, partial [Methanomassiliicoccales archaeon]|nr:proton-conducting transporter membrane subunit [Methanomassiliicoccales archaeon]
LAAGSKKMGFVAMFKFFLIAMLAIKADWEIVVAVLAIVTMTVGNLAALNQTSIKRMLAYSSIAQAGYILIAVAVGTEYAVTGGIFHILTHAFMKGGAFIIVATLTTVAIGERISDYKGLAKRSNFMAFSMTVLLFSLAGIPPLAGFASKVVLFSSPIMGTVDGSEWMVWLAVAGIINSAISLYYYARVVKYMYVDELEEGEPSEKLKLPRSMVAAVAICVVAIIGIGVFPEYFIQLCQNAAQALFA